VATTSNDGRIYLFDAEAAVNHERADEERVLDVGTDTIWAIALSSDNQYVASANDDDVLQIMFKATGRTVAWLKGEKNQGRTRALAFSPNGRELAAAGDDYQLRLWDWEATTFRAFAVEHDDRIFSIAYSPDGSLVAGAGQDGLAVIWRVADGTVVHRFKYENTRLWAVVFDPSGDYVAIGGDEHTVDIWSVLTGERVDRLAGHSRRVWSVVYSPDGKLIASGSTDGTVRLWRVGEGGHAKPAATLLGFPNGSVAITPDGRYKTDGDVANEFWYVVGMARFEPGELDRYLPDLAPLDTDFPLL
jgi:WD40 repeat protein